MQKIGKAVEKIYKADSLNIAMQDGAAAGQSCAPPQSLCSISRSLGFISNRVPHVHTHIIPRQFQDLEKEDQIYAMLESEDGDLGRNYLAAQHPAAVDTNGEQGGSAAVGKRPKFPTVHPDSERRPRTEQMMKEEADWLAQRITESDID